MQNYVITITRQFGSRGRDIGIATAKKLGIPLYDRNVLEKEAEEIDRECNCIFLTAFFYSLITIHKKAL